MPSDSLVLTKALNGVLKSQDAFVNATAKWGAQCTEVLENIEMSIKSKKRKLDEVSTEFEQRYRSAEIDLDQQVRSDSYGAACKTLDARGETPIAKEALDTLRADLKNAKAFHVEDMKQTLHAEKQRNAKALVFMERTLKLEMAVQMAGLKANHQRLQDHVGVLESQLANARTDLDKQRELTQSVAESARPAPVVFQPK